MPDTIGYLLRGTHFLCPDCSGKRVDGWAAPVARENIGSYGQGCHQCHKLIVEPAKGWPELFSVGCPVCKTGPSGIDYSGLPESLRGGVQRYIEDQIKPGGFLSAVISNDLYETLARADPANMLLLPRILSWFLNEAPVTCWGSREHMCKWLNS